MRSLYDSKSVTIGATFVIDRPTPLNLLSYPDARALLSEPLYVGLSANASSPILRMILKVTESPYCHAFVIGHGGSDVMLLTESTTPCAQVSALSDRINAQ